MATKTDKAKQARAHRDVLRGAAKALRRAAQFLENVAIEENKKKRQQGR